MRHISMATWLACLVVVVSVQPSVPVPMGADAAPGATDLGGGPGGGGGGGSGPAGGASSSAAASGGGTTSSWPPPGSPNVHHQVPGGPALLSPRVVYTKSGPLQGLILSMDGVATGPGMSGLSSGPARSLPPVEAFLGVPYATPPVGGNRFSPTRAPVPWEGVRVVNRTAPACPQRPPSLRNESALLEKMPRGRLQQLKRLLPFVEEQSEDCLYLNIYTPAQAGASDVRPTRPVMVYIHGESYSWSTGSAYDGSILAAYSDVVVVTINYRLGVLGFLNANPKPENRALVANYGLMDQIAALHWLKENIGLFGGDRSNVTLIGHGTGAACIHFLMMSPAVSGLFQRAILMSGSALSPWALVSDPVGAAVRVATALNCSVPSAVDLPRDHEKIVDCLRGAPLGSLLDAAAALPAPDYLSVFGPSVDGVVIRRDLVKEFLSASRKGREGQDGKEAYIDGAGVDSWSAGNLASTSKGYSVLCGVVTNEALFNFPEKAVQAGLSSEQRDRILRTFVRNAYTHHLAEILSTVVNEYTDWERTAVHPVNTRDATVAALSDAQFVAPLVQAADGVKRPGTTPGAGPGGSGPSAAETSSPAGGGGALLRSHGPGPYFYVFDYQTRDGDYPQKLGPVHGDELAYIFGAPLAVTVRAFPSNYSRTEVSLSEAVMAYWTNFARTGNPNLSSASQTDSGREKGKQRGNVFWDEYDAGHQKYLEINTKPRMKNHFRAHKMSIWLRLIPELHRAGQEDVVARHNLFRNHNESALYDGIVRPDPLGRVYGIYRGELADYGEDTGAGASRGSAKAVQPAKPAEQPSTLPTCVNVPAPQSSGSSNNNNNISPSASGSGPSHNNNDMEPEGLAAYSTALGVTLAIGCSLLVLNVLIFAGVFYQRDRTRLQVKSLKQQQQRLRGACEDLAGGGSEKLSEKNFPHLRHSFSSSVLVDMERDKASSQQPSGHEAKSPVAAIKNSKSGSLAYSGQPPNYTSSYLHQVPPTEFGDNSDSGPNTVMMRHSFHTSSTFRDASVSACTTSGDPSKSSIAMLGPPGHLIRGDRNTSTLPRNIGLVGKLEVGVQAPLTAPNGCAAPIHHTLPRPPPPPRVNSRPSDAPQSGGNCPGSMRLPQAALSEMRV